MNCPKMPKDVDVSLSDKKDNSNTQVLAISSDDQFLLNHPYSVMVIMLVAPPTILLAFVFVLWAAQLLW